MVTENAVPYQNAGPQSTYRGQPDKRRAIAHAARAVFGREGYSGASVDEIAAAAGVSKRTIYNHYVDKEQLFQSVIIEGSAMVAETHTQIADRHLRKILDVEEDLVAFALELANSPAAFEGHFALVRTIQAEAARIPPAVLQAWQDTGPRAFQRELARCLRRMADGGLLIISDAETAAVHFNLLTFVSVVQRSFYGSIPLGETETDELVKSGVRAFLRIYGRASGEIPQSDTRPPR